MSLARWKEISCLLDIWEQKHQDCPTQYLVHNENPKLLTAGAFKKNAKKVRSIAKETGVAKQELIEWFTQSEEMIKAMIDE